MSIILVSGALANKCHNGGEAWVRLSWVQGLRKLGFDVNFVEQIAADTCVDRKGNPAAFGDSVNLEYFRSITERFGLKGRAALVLADGSQCAGMTWNSLLDVARSAELLVNVSGHLRLEPLMRAIRRKAYIDIDPGFTQFWHADPDMPFRVDGHDEYFTIGENIGTPQCSIPTGGIRWRAVRQPVVLEDWPVFARGNRNRFTTVASWRGAFGPVQFGGRKFGLKLHEFRNYLRLPEMAAAHCHEIQELPPEFEIALDIHPSDEKDRDSLEANGWHIVEPKSVASDADAFRNYVQHSGAEFSVAQGIYVDTHSGWFSDRTVRYLASGKPALVQETGFSRHIKTGTGLIGFSTPRQAANAAAEIVKHYQEHSAAARAVAEQYFDSNKVLGRFLEEMDIPV